MKTIKNELAHWLILAVPFIYLASVYSYLPGTIATHFNISATPDKYGNKYTLLWEIPLITIGTYLLLLFVSKVAQRQQLAFVPGLINTIRLVITVALSALAVVTIYMSQPTANLKLGAYLIGTVVLLLIVSIFLFVYFLYKKIYSQAAPAALNDIKNYYKWGLFYYNSKDKRMWVPKLVGIGWTLNFANPISYVIMVALFAFIIWSIVR